MYKTVFEICQNSKSKFGEREFQTLYGWLKDNYRGMKGEHVGMLMEAVCTICSELPPDKLPMAV